MDDVGPVNGNLGVMEKQQLAVIVGKLLFFAQKQQFADFSIRCIIQKLCAPIVKTFSKPIGKNH